MNRNSIKLFGLCLLLLLIVTPVIAAPACSFCEFINISKGDPGAPGLPGSDGAPGLDGSPGTPGAPGAANMTMNQTPNMTASNIDTSWNLSYYLRDTSRSLTGMSINRDVNNDVLSIIGGSGTTPYGANLQLYGGGNVAQSGGAIFSIGDAAGTGTKVVWSILGTTNTPSLDMNNNKIINLLNPTQPQDAATKYYVDNLAIIGGLMNQTSNMTAGPIGPINLTANMTAGPTGTTGATGGSGGQLLYFDHLASPDIPKHEILNLIPAGNPEADETVTVKTGLGQVLIDNYTTNIGYPALTEIPAGLWRFRSFHYVSGASGITNVVFKVYNRTATGTETLLFTVTSDDINTLTVDEYLTSYVTTTAYKVSSTDRIVCKIYGQSDHSSNIIFHFVYDGSIHTSHIQSPLDISPATTLTFSAIAGETLKKGQAVYISGASGSDPQISLADNTVTAKSRVVGLVTTDVTSGLKCQVRRNGILTSVNTLNSNLAVNPSAETWVAGDLLFVTVTGGMTKIRPISGRSVKAAYSLLGSNANDVLLAYPMENPVWVTAASNEDIVLRLGDNSGSTNISIRNYSNNQVAYINSIGQGNFNGSIMQNNNISTVKDPVAAQDAATKNYVDTQSPTNLSAIYPIGSVYISTLSTNPNTTFHWGCWTSLGTGYVLVGV